MDYESTVTSREEEEEQEEEEEDPLHPCPASVCRDTM